MKPTANGSDHQTTGYMRRGQAAIHAQNPAEATDWFEKAVRDNPKDPQAKACLGQSLCWLGRHREGVAQLRQAGQLLAKKARKTRDISAMLSLTEQLQYWNDYAGALELGKLAVQINPAEVRGFQLLALTQSRLNQRQAALLNARQAVKLAPHSAMLQILLASLESVDQQYASAKRRLERALQLPLSAEEAFRAHKELARVLDKTGNHAQVFTHLHSAAELSTSLPAVRSQDRALVPGMIANHRAGFDRALFQRCGALAATQAQAAPVFLMGFMRSGTTLTQQVLDAHPQVFVADETDLVMALHEELHKRDVTAATTAEKLRRLDAAGIEHLRAFYWASVRSRYGERLGQRLLVDKTTMNTIDVGLINCVFPEAKVLFAIRDPRDVCLSCFMQTMIPTPSTVHLLHWQATATFYALIMDWWQYIKGQLTLPFMEFRYEDAIADFENTFGRLFDFLGLAWDPAVAEFHTHAAGKYINSPSFSQVTQPLYTSSVARWRYYEKDFAAIAEELRPFVQAFGYSP